MTDEQDCAPHLVRVGYCGKGRLVRERIIRGRPLADERCYIVIGVGAHGIFAHSLKQHHNDIEGPGGCETARGGRGYTSVNNRFKNEQRMCVCCGRGVDELCFRNNSAISVPQRDKAYPYFSVLCRFSPLTGLMVNGRLFFPANEGAATGWLGVAKPISKGGWAKIL